MFYFGKDQGIFEGPPGGAISRQAGPKPTAVRRAFSSGSTLEGAPRMGTIARRAAVAFDAVPPASAGGVTLEQDLIFDLGRNVLVHGNDLTQPQWLLSGATRAVQAGGEIKLTESSALASAHIIYQTITEANLVDDGGVASAQVWVKDGNRGFCFVGWRQNSVFYSAIINLTTGALVAGGQGSNISSVVVESATEEFGAGWWKIRIVGLPTGVNTVLAIGLSDGTVNTAYDGNGTSFIYVRRAQAWQGSSEQVWYDAGVRAVVYDVAGTHPAGVTVNAPDMYQLDRAVFDGVNDALTVSTWNPQSDAVTYEAHIDELTGSGIRSIVARWEEGANNRSVHFFIDGSAKFAVKLSGNGSTTAKNYVVNTPTIDAGRHLITARFDAAGDGLDLFIDGAKIPSGDITKVADAALSAIFQPAVNWTIGARDTLGLTEFFAGALLEWRIWNGARSDADILARATELGLGAGGGGDELTYADWKARVAPAGTLYVVNKFHGSASDSNAGTPAAPWATIQHALDVVTNPADSIWIEGGTGIDDRYYEELVPPASGSAATDAGRIWLVGNPAQRPIVDGSIPLSATWTSQGNGVYRAPVSITAPGFIASAGYYGDCGTPTKLYENIFEQIQIVHRPASGNDYALHAMNFPETGTPATTAFLEGDFWAEGGHTSPTAIWVKLPGSLNPNTQSMRWVDKERLFDWKGANDSLGRNYIGMANIDWAYGAGAQTQKHGVVVARGTGWRFEKCSFRDGNVTGLTLWGKDHYVYNCQALRNGVTGFGARGVDDNNPATDCENVIFERCYARYNNAKGFDAAWDAGGWKNTTINTNNTAGRGVELIECYSADNGAGATWPGRGHYGPGVWFDVEAHKCAVRRSVMVRNGKNGLMQELATNDLTVEHCVMAFNNLDDDGCAGSNLGSGIKIQAANHGNYDRCTIYRNQGKGAYIKATDGRAADNFHTFTNCLWVENGQGGGAVSFGDHEVFVQNEDDSPFNPASTNTFNGNVFKPKTGNNSFYNGTPGIATETNSTGVWYTWVGGSGDVVTTNQVLTDASSEFGFVPVAAYASKGADITHPLNFATYWNVQRFAQPI